MRPTTIGSILGLSALCTSAVAGDWQDCAGRDVERAIRGCSTVIDNVSEPSANRASAHYNRAVAFTTKRNFDRAIADFDATIRLEPKFASAYCSRGWAYTYRRQYEQAASDCKKCIAINPRQGDAYACRARALLTAGNLISALTDAERAAALAPQDADVLQTRALVYEAFGQRENAIADYRKALQFGPLIDESREGLRRLGAAP
jgi:tetratricopeptide (TPR) repeat protein